MIIFTAYNDQLLNKAETFQMSVSIFLFPLGRLYIYARKASHMYRSPYTTDIRGGYNTTHKYTTSNTIVYVSYVYCQISNLPAGRLDVLLPSSILLVYLPMHSV